MPVISRGFHGRHQDEPSDRVPPGQYVTGDFPVLSAGPTPHTHLDSWTFEIQRGGDLLASLDLGGVPGPARASASRRTSTA